MVKVEVEGKTKLMYIKCFHCESILSFEKKDVIDGHKDKMVICPYCGTGLIVEKDGSEHKDIRWSDNIESLIDPDEKEVKIKLIKTYDDYQRVKYKYAVVCNDIEIFSSSCLSEIFEVYENPKTMANDIYWEE